MALFTHNENVQDRGVVKQTMICQRDGTVVKQLVAELPQACVAWHNNHLFLAHITIRRGLVEERGFFLPHCHSGLQVPAFTDSAFPSLSDSGRGKRGCRARQTS